MPGLARVLAPIPSPMTYHGTNTYLLGDRSLAVIDPGPADAAHLDALLRAIAGRRVSHIIVTHSHLDHSPLAQPLSKATGAPVLAFGAWDSGRSPIMAQLAFNGLAGGGEGVDRDFAPDVTLADGAMIRGDEWALQALHTPGHMGNHLCLDWSGTVFTGDHVMGWSSSLVSPPDGDLTDFMTSLDRLLARPALRYFPGHGDPVEAPHARLTALRDHRLGREAQILDVLREGPADIARLTGRVYADTPPKMHPAAARNLFAHLVDLVQRSRVQARPALSIDAEFWVLSP